MRMENSKRQLANYTLNRVLATMKWKVILSIRWIMMHVEDYHKYENRKLNIQMCYILNMKSTGMIKTEPSFVI